MKLIPLTQGQFAKVDDCDFDWLSKWKWYAQWKSHTQSFYAIRGVYESGRQHTTYMHREILGLQRGDGKKVDHWSGDTLDNQRHNLRATDTRGNAQNHKRHRAGRLVGASFHKQSGKWRARAVIDGEQTHLGLFSTEQEAHERYMKVAG
jgi:hypothetical protein